MPLTPRPLHHLLCLLIAVAAGAAVAPASAGVGVPWLDAAGRPLPFAGEAQLLDFLREAPVVARRQLAIGLTRPEKLTLERDGGRLDAIFRTVDESSPGGADRWKRASGRQVRDSYRHEIAAFELDRLLDIGRVPPTVLRTVDGSAGSLQLWVELAETQADRIRERRGPEDALAMTRQRQLMRLFDVLIHNTDRNHGNMLIRRAPASSGAAGDELLFIDHTRAFQASLRLLPDRDELVMIDPLVLARLRALDPATLDAALSPHLDIAELDALQRRRRQLLRWVDERIERLGPAAVLVAAGRGPAAAVAATVAADGGD